MLGFAGMGARLRHGMLLLAAVFGVAGTAQAVPQLQLNMGAPQYFDTDSIGTDGEGSLGFTFQLLNGETANPPFTLKVTLPPHVTYRGHTTGPWTCTGAGSQATCTYPHALDMWNWGSSGLGIYIDVDGDLPVPGNSPVRMTLESAQVPLAMPLVCEDVPSFNFATSDTGCVERMVPHRQSQLVFVPAAWQHQAPVFEAGTRGTIQVAWRSIGYGISNGTVTARILLPPGLTYHQAGGITQWTCNAATPDAQGQLLTCTTPAWFDGMNESQANMVLHVNIAPDVPTPGPLPIFATISNHAQPPPDFALCDDPSPPLGCGFYSVPTRTARISRMDIVEILPQQPRFSQGQQARVAVTYTNLGEGNATAATLAFALPPGFAYASQTASPPLNCAVSAGTPATGQTLTCNYPATYPAGVNGGVNLVLDVVAGAALQSTLIGSASDDGRPGPTLAQCIADPASPEPMVGCGRAVLEVSPWMFCDGVERLHRACGQPQGF